MKKNLCLALCVILCLGLLTGCGKKYDAEESTIYVEKKGVVVATDVQEFDESVYSLDDLKDYIKETIDAYNDENGSKSVTLKKVTVKDNVCSMTIKYASYEDYAKFNGCEIFVGSVAEALAAGYSFDDIEFASVDGESATVCEASEFLDSSENYKVAILKDDAYRIHTYGKVNYVSTSNTSIVDQKTISFALGNLLEGVSTPSTEEGTETCATEVYGEDTQESASDGSVSDEELAEEGEEDTEEVVFDFSDADNSSETVTESLGYVYIIFK